MYNFEKLDVYKIAMKIVNEVYRITKKFPDEEKFGLISQIRRAAVSVALNITEGSGQKTKKGFRVYIRNAISSDLEVITCIGIALQQEFVGKPEARLLEELLKEEYYKLIALEKSLS